MMFFIVSQVLGEAHARDLAIAEWRLSRSWADAVTSERTPAPAIVGPFARA